MKSNQIKKLVGIIVCLFAIYFASSMDFTNEESITIPYENFESISTYKSSTDGSSTAQTEATYEFRTEKLYNSHYEKHGKEFGDISKVEYLELANQLIDSETALRKTEKEDGDDVIYDEENNYFLILSKDGYIRTFFRPDAGLEYYERQ